MNRKVKPENRGVCERMAEIRERASMTQFDFAKALGVNRASISAIEAGYFTPSFELLRKVHKKFGVPYEFIIDGSSGANPSRELSEIQRLYDKLKDDYEILHTAYRAIRSK